MGALDLARLSLDGLSVGDAFGERFFVAPPVLQQLIAQRAVPAAPWKWTDDTAMALEVVAVLSEEGRIDADALARGFGRRYGADPLRGYGRAAHEILADLRQGADWRLAAGAVFGGQGSLGNGGAMRVAPLGAFFSSESDGVVVEQAAVSAQVTHAHPEGQAGAVAVALAAAWAARNPGAGARSIGMLAHAHAFTPESQVRAGLAAALALPFESSVEAAVAALGNGARVTAMDTVPFALWCAARHADDYREALWTTVSGLGDRDTTCAIVGGIVALSAGPVSIPREWLEAREALDGAAG